MNQSPPLFYTGTPYVCNWGESKDQHGVWVFDSDAGSLRFVPVKDKPFVTFDLAVDNWLSDGTPLDLAVEEGAAVRVRYTCDEEQARRLDQAAIRRVFMEAGASKVVFRPTVERAVRARVEAMDESLDETEALDLWLSSQNGQVSVDPEALRVLHSEFLERAK